MIVLNQNDTVAFSGANDHFSQTSAKYYRFQMTGTLEANGNIQSLMNYSDNTTNNCYCRLFSGCTSLTKAPQLPATTLAYRCYQGMFEGCTNLSSMNVAFTDWTQATDATTNWVTNVAANGIFTKPDELSAEFGVSRIPDGWTVVDK